MRFLFVTGERPYPPMAGQARRQYHLARELTARGHDSQLAMILPPRQKPSDAFPRLREVFEAVHWVQAPGSRDELDVVDSAPFLRQRLADAYLPFIDHQVVRAIRSIVGNTRFDAVIFGGLETGALARFLPPNLSRVLDAPYLPIPGSRRVIRPVGFFAAMRHASRERLLARSRRRVLSSPWLSIVASGTEDRTWLRRRARRTRITLVKDGVDVPWEGEAPEGSAAPGDEPTLVIAGRLDRPSEVSRAAWFVRHVVPSLRQILPSLTVTLGSPRLTPALEALRTHEGVRVLLGPEEANAALETATLAVFPFERPERGLILEAMVRGRAVVTTPEAAWGLGGEDGRDLALATEEDSFISRCSKLLIRRDLAAEMGQEARRWCLRHATWDAVMRRLAPVLGHIRSNDARPKPLSPVKIPALQAKAPSGRARA